jgi:starvation-inducible DNA-binding protein
MSAFHCSRVNDPRAVPVSADGDAESRKTIAVLEELLDQSIYLRDLYKNARWQATDIRHRRVRQLFDRHYKEQFQLVDVLADRIRLLGGAHQLFGSQFLQDTRFACALRGHKATDRLLRELLDAHDSVLSTGRPHGSALDDQWTRDFAVGQVVLTNDAQSSSISDQLADRDPRQRVPRQHAIATLDDE